MVGSVSGPEPPGAQNGPVWTGPAQTPPAAVRLLPVPPQYCPRAKPVWTGLGHPIGPSRLTQGPHGLDT